MSLTLAIDTTSRNCSISVLEGKNALVEYNFVSSGELSETLIPHIDNIFSSLKIGVEEIGLVGASVGPGLFTGIRVGLATLKGIFFNREVPVVPVVSLNAIAMKLLYTGMKVVPVIDARRGEIYTAVYQFNKGKVLCINDPVLINLEYLDKFLGSKEDICFTGPGISVYRDFIIKEFPESLIAERSPFTSYEVGIISKMEYEEGKSLKGVSSLEPIYIRIPDAEKNFGSGKD